MKYLVIFALCVAVTQAHNVGRGKVSTAAPGGRIFHGEKAVNKQFPHMVFSAGCGASLISDKWVLSAAHCYTDEDDPNVLIIPDKVYLGDVEWKKSPVVVGAVYTFVHPRWDWRDPGYDIAIVELNQAVPFSETIKPIRIPSSRDELFDGELALVSGFGLTENFAYPDDLLYVQQRVISRAECQRLSHSVKEKVLCAVGHPSQIQSTCYGDSGGPLIVKRPEGDILIGIVSNGARFCNGVIPTQYVKPNLHLEWIGSITGLIF